VIVVRVKVSRGIVPFFPMGMDSADSSQPPPMGRFAWINHIYFQITQPGGSIVTSSVPIEALVQNCRFTKPDLGIFSKT
jgi:hypothetical protein